MHRRGRRQARRSLWRLVRARPLSGHAKCLRRQARAPADGFVGAVNPAVDDAGGRDVRRRLRIRLVPRCWRPRGRGRGPASKDPQSGAPILPSTLQVGSLSAAVGSGSQLIITGSPGAILGVPHAHALTPGGTGAQRPRRPRRREDLRSSVRAGSYTCSAVSEPCQRGSAVRDVRVQCASIPHVQATSTTP